MALASKRKRMPSKFGLMLTPFKDLILGGELLCIDPSSGSKQSMPGYALFSGGQLKDSGIIQLRAGENLHNRLFVLADTLRNSFDTPDMLITENIQMFMGEGNKQFMNKSVLSLQRSIGVVQSAFNCPCVEVSPRTWRSFIPESYTKTDENDAIMFGLATLWTLQDILDIERTVVSPTLRKKLTTGEW